MKKNNILVVAAHPDDEVLGLGGTLCKHRDANDTLHILILANGEDARDNDKKIPERLSQAKQVADLLNATLHLEDLPDNKFDTKALLDITKRLETVITDIQPDIVYTHHAHDLNVDHRLTFQAVLTACRPQPGHCIREIRTFETLSSSEWQVDRNDLFCPNYYVDISCYLKKKLQLINIYKDELRDYPHPRSLQGIETIARYRGMTVGYKVAEAFTIIRKLDS